MQTKAYLTRVILYFYCYIERTNPFFPNSRHYIFISIYKGKTSYKLMREEFSAAVLRSGVFSLNLIDFSRRRSSFSRFEFLVTFSVSGMRSKL